MIGDIPTNPMHHFDTRIDEISTDSTYQMGGGVVVTLCVKYKKGHSKEVLFPRMCKKYQEYECYCCLTLLRKVVILYGKYKKEQSHKINFQRIDTLKKKLSLIWRQRR